MPRYEHSPSSVVASIEVFPKDDYEFIIGEPKAFSRTNNEGKTSYGVRYSLTVGDGDYKGKRTVMTLYQHTEGSLVMAKQFQMAALGYGKGRAEEQRFDADWGSKDWSFDTDSGAVGDPWRELTGKRVIGSLDQNINTTTGDAQQNFKGWRPLGA